jgi:catechol 2,3-dioxygenase-like lactoylglutathione lyase family enzyme
MSEQTRTHITGVRTVKIPVTDQDKALEFYTDKLGFETRMDVRFGDDRRWVEVAPPGATTTIALALPDPGERCGVDTGIRLTTVDAETDHATLRTRGVDADPQVTRWQGVPPMFSLRDPDGNTLVIIELMAA